MTLARRASDQAIAPSRYVLVVEAEPLLMLMAIETIEDAGFGTATARCVGQAIAILEQRTDIRIVFIDIDVSGGLDGMKLAACVRDRWPPIEIILTSGGPAPDDAALPPRGIFIPKPYSSKTLGELVNRLGRRD